MQASLAPIVISIYALLIQYNHVEFCALKLYYAILCHVRDRLMRWTMQPLRVTPIIPDWEDFRNA